MTPSAAQLVEAFLAGKATPPADAPAFERQLVARLEEATAAHPFEPLRLARALGERAPAGEASEALAALHPTDVALALLAAEHQPAALNAFERVLVEQVRLAVSGIDPSPSFADEVAQVLRQRLLLADEGRPPRLLDFSGRGALGKWLKVAALRTALSLRRGLHAQAEPDDALADLAAPGHEPELELLRGRYRAQFRDAFSAAFGALTSQQRNLLRLHHLEDATLAQLGHHSGLHRTTVARHLEQARQVLFDETRRRIAEQLQLGREDFEALIALLRSQLDVSIRRFLKDTKG